MTIRIRCIGNIIINKTLKHIILWNNLNINIISKNFESLCIYQISSIIDNFICYSWSWNLNCAIFTIAGKGYKPNIGLSFSPKTWKIIACIICDISILITKIEIIIILYIVQSIFVFIFNPDSSPAFTIQTLNSSYITYITFFSSIITSITSFKANFIIHSIIVSKINICIRIMNWSCNTWWLNTLFVKVVCITCGISFCSPHTNWFKT